MSSFHWAEEYALDKVVEVSTCTSPECIRLFLFFKKTIWKGPALPELDGVAQGLSTSLPLTWNCLHVAARIRPKVPEKPLDRRWAGGSGIVTGSGTVLSCTSKADTARCARSRNKNGTLMSDYEPGLPGLWGIDLVWEEVITMNLMSAGRFINNVHFHNYGES